MLVSIENHNVTEDDLLVVLCKQVGTLNFTQLKTKTIDLLASFK